MAKDTATRAARTEKLGAAVADFDVLPFDGNAAARYGTLVALAVGAPGGFTVADLAARVHTITGNTDYTARHAAYDQRKLHGKTTHHQTWPIPPLPGAHTSSPHHHRSPSTARPRHRTHPRRPPEAPNRPQTHPLDPH
ncbi:MAG: hypothetical protein ACRDRA_03380 [Pseudonocardiaceae bacterium]